ARASIRARQLLLIPKSGESIFPPTLSHADIVTKLKETLRKARTDATPAGNLRAVTVLHGGGIIVEMETESLASWCRSPNGRTAFEEHLESTASLSNRTFPIVLQYLPIQTKIEQAGFLRLVEKENSLPEHTLTALRWIKPPQRRSKEQQKAFAILHVADAQMANDILKEGICIDKQRIAVRKDKKEPIRCARCQRFSHIARNCTAPSDACGTCGNQHRTADCTSRSERCINCRTHFHTSWSRECPEFKRRCADLDEKYPENQMPYFPTEEAW
ncbi:hypothetical protein M405DRAFT_711533, partial [Rhizopogon salebrosus TDB-379]